MIHLIRLVHDDKSFALVSNYFEQNGKKFKKN